MVLITLSTQLEELRETGPPPCMFALDSGVPESMGNTLDAPLRADRRPSQPLSPSETSGEPSPTQKRILDYVADHPGAHLRLICRELGLAMGDVQYHVHRLEREGRINSVRRGLYRFFYPATLFGGRQRDILGLLALDTPRELLLHLVENPDLSQDELARVIGVSQPTVSWHLKRMVERGILERRQSGRGASYAMAGGGAAEVAALIRSYHPGVWERWSSRLADIFISYSGEEGGDKA